MEIFFSYSHQDEGLRNELENHIVIMRAVHPIKQYYDCCPEQQLRPVPVPLCARAKYLFAFFKASVCNGGLWSCVETRA